MRIFTLFLFLVLCALSPARAEMRTIVEGLPPVDWDQDTLSLPPAYFPEMPEQLRAWLEAREYRIPQVHDSFIDTFGEGVLLKHRKYNIISGNFDETNGQDWVVVTIDFNELKAFICWKSDTCDIQQLDISEFDSYPKGYRLFYSQENNIRSYVSILACVRKEWLNSESSSIIENIHGDNTELPLSFSHDGFVLESGGDMWNSAYIRYFVNGKWLNIYHEEALKKATMDATLLNEH